MKYVEPFKGSKRFHRWSALSVFAAVLERKVWLNVGGFGKIYPNMYVVLCGEPGLGKTASSNFAFSLLKGMNEILGDKTKGVRFGPDKVTPAALLSRFEKSCKSVLVDGKGLAHSSIYLHSTELSTLIKDIGGGSLSDDFLKLYDCDEFFEKETMKDGVISIIRPCLNMLADTTPSFLSGFLPRESSGSGLTARMIFATELGRVPKNYDPPETDKDLQEKLLHGLLRMYKLTGTFTIDKSGKDWLADYLPKNDEKMYTINAGNFMRHFYARKPVHVQKVAITISACENDEKIITDVHLQEALNLINEAEPTMERSFGTQDFRSSTDVSKQILEVMPFGVRLSKAELIQVLFNSGLAGSITEFESYLEYLVQGQFITRQNDSGNVYYKKVL